MEQKQHFGELLQANNYRTDLWPCWLTKLKDSTLASLTQQNEKDLTGWLLPPRSKTKIFHSFFKKLGILRRRVSLDHPELT